MQEHLPGGWGTSEQSADRSGSGLNERRPSCEADLLGLMFDAAPIPKALVGPDGDWLVVNPALCRLLGYPEGVLRGLRCQDVTHPEDLATCADQWEKLAAGDLQGFSLEKRYVRADGRPVWVELHVNALRDTDGTVERFAVQMIDVDERHRLREAAADAERRLAAANAAMTASMAAAQVSRARYEALVDHLPDTAVYVYDSRGRIVTAEGSSIEARGFNRRALLGKRAEDVLAPGDAELMKAILERSEAGQPTSIDVRLSTTGLDNLVDAIPVARPDGQHETLVLARDISALKQGRQRLERAEHRLRALFDQAPSAILESTLDAVVIGGNPNLSELTGRSLEELEGRSWWDFVHPDDLPRLQARVAARLQDEPLEPEAEYRLLQADGGEVWVNTRASLMTVGDGPAAIVVHLTDVSEQREQRRLVDEINSRFAALVQNCSDVITVLDHDLCCTYASPSYRSVFGRTVDAVVGTPATDRIHPDDQVPFAQAMDRLRATPGSMERFDIRIEHPVKGWRWIELTASNQLEHPAVKGIVCNVRDVTDRVQLTDKLAYQAMHDPLTDLANRALLVDRIGVAISHAERVYTSVAVLYLDLDGFKAVNDRHGHAAGDQLLMVVAERLKDVTRPGDTVARLGGDEFVVVSSDFSEAAAIELAERLRAAVQEPTSIDGYEIVIRCSIGIELARTGGPAEALSRADTALYEAKRHGRNRWQLASPDGQISVRPPLRAIG
jgi:diguanylate cyclase (GGDEF)-like protein/PAS domain S-box-containing protein